MQPGRTMCEGRRRKTMETHSQDNRAHLTIDISPELREHLQAAAAQRNISIQEYIQELLQQIVFQETKISHKQRHPMTPETYEAILQLREQIKQDRQGRPF